jgi:hypothetical protein
MRTFSALFESTWKTSSQQKKKFILQMIPEELDFKKIKIT